MINFSSVSGTNFGVSPKKIIKAVANTDGDVCLALSQHKLPHSLSTHDINATLTHLGFAHKAHEFSDIFANGTCVSIGRGHKKNDLAAFYRTIKKVVSK